MLYEIVEAFLNAYQFAAGGDSGAVIPESAGFCGVNVPAVAGSSIESGVLSWKEMHMVDP